MSKKTVQKLNEVLEGIDIGIVSIPDLTTIINSAVMELVELDKALERTNSRCNATRQDLEELKNSYANLFTDKKAMEKALERGNAEAKRKEADYADLASQYFKHIEELGKYKDNVAKLEKEAKELTTKNIIQKSALDFKNLQYDKVIEANTAWAKKAEELEKELQSYKDACLKLPKYKHGKPDFSQFAEYCKNDYDTMLEFSGLKVNNEWIKSIFKEEKPATAYADNEPTIAVSEKLYKDALAKIKEYERVDKNLRQKICDMGELMESDNKEYRGEMLKLTKRCIDYKAQIRELEDICAIKDIIIMQNKAMEKTCVKINADEITITGSMRIDDWSRIRKNGGMIK